ncbi:MAG: CopG family transcriptional regulator [Actinomycetota bacterium]
MKTSLNINKGLMIRLKLEAARRGTTMSRLVEAALRLLLDRPPEQRQLLPLPTFDGGQPLVDISDRDALYRTIDDR